MIFGNLGHHITITVLKVSGHIVRDYAKNEILAELVAYLLLKKFDEDINYNFAHSNMWANRITDVFELDEFMNCLKSISKYI